MIEWLYEDAKLLRENNRKRGCLCLLLCLIDALAKKENPDKLNNRQRYCTYIKKKMKEIDIDTSSRIEEKNDLMHLGDIIYEYFRCNFIHEGDSREKSEYEVQIEYDILGRFNFSNSATLMDRINKKFIVRSDWLIDVLFEIAKTEIKV